jgi:hypothetical protein
MMTQDTVDRFVKYNDKSPVVEGFAIENGGMGAVYTLKNGRRIELDRDDCRSLPPGYPKWDIDGHFAP